MAALLGNRQDTGLGQVGLQKEAQYHWQVHPAALLCLEGEQASGPYQLSGT